jgi:hypothetical protein
MNILPDWFRQEMVLSCAHYASLNCREYVIMEFILISQTAKNNIIIMYHVF